MTQLELRDRGEYRALALAWIACIVLLFGCGADGFGQGVLQNYDAASDGALVACSDVRVTSSPFCSDADALTGLPTTGCFTDTGESRDGCVAQAAVSVTSTATVDVLCVARCP
jgi:hypothetical protein